MTAPDADPLAPRSPLSLQQWPRSAPAPFQNATCTRIEFSARGDRVPGRVLVPNEDTAHPLVILQSDACGRMDSPFALASSAWLTDGFAVASIDLPLHGRRASPKLSERLHAMLDGTSDRSPGLLAEFMHQSIDDLARLTDAATQLPGVDAKHIGYAGVGVGATTGALFCALDPRPCAVALIGPQPLPGVADRRLDPLVATQDIAPRPLLLVDGDPGADLDAALEEPRAFLRGHLGA